MNGKLCKSQTKKILIVTPYMETGGTEKLIIDLVRGLISRGWRVFVLSSGGCLAPQIESLGASHYIVDTLSQKTPYALLRSALAIRKIVSEHGVGVVSSNSYAAAVAVAFSKIISSLYFYHVLTIHLPEKEAYFRVIGLTANSIANEICAICHWTKDKLVKSGVSEGRISVIYNGVDTAYFSPSSIDQKPEVRFKVGVVARLVERKGHAVLLRAVRRYLDNNPFRELKLLFYGDGSYKQALKDQSKLLGLEHVVLFMGETSDVRAAYRDMDLFVLPSFSEGLPLVILEAMSAGVPVVATRVNGIPEVIDDGNSGITFVPDDDKALCQIIEELIANPGLRKRLAHNAYLRVREQFDLGTMVDEYEKLFLSAKPGG